MYKCVYIYIYIFDIFWNPQEYISPDWLGNF